MIIYIAINKINNKCYIGQTVGTLNTRKREHFYDSSRDNLYFHNALKKYGKENFTWEILRECESILELNRMEVFYIWLLKTKKPNGYNLTDGGKNSRLSEEIKNKIRIARKGGKASKETKKIMQIINAGIRNPFYGKHHSDETKRKISEKAKQRIFIKGHPKGFSGKHHSVESKLKTSNTFKIRRENKLNKNG